MPVTTAPEGLRKDQEAKAILYFEVRPCQKKKLKKGKECKMMSMSLVIKEMEFRPQVKYCCRKTAKVYAR